MADVSFEREIVSEIHDLKPEQQREVLQYIRTLKRPKGTPGKLAVQMAQEIGFSHEDLEEMERAINELDEYLDEPPEVDLDE